MTPDSFCYYWLPAGFVIAPPVVVVELPPPIDPPPFVAVWLYTLFPLGVAYPG